MKLTEPQKRVRCLIGLHKWRWIPRTFNLQQYCVFCGKARQAVSGVWGWKTIGWADWPTLEDWNQGKNHAIV